MPRTESVGNRRVAFHDRQYAVQQRIATIGGRNISDIPSRDIPSDIYVPPDAEIPLYTSSSFLVAYKEVGVRGGGIQYTICGGYGMPVQQEFGMYILTDRMGVRCLSAELYVTAQPQPAFIHVASCVQGLVEGFVRNPFSRLVDILAIRE